MGGSGSAGWWWGGGVPPQQCHMHDSNRPITHTVMLGLKTPNAMFHPTMHNASPT